MNNTPTIVGITPRVQELGRTRMGDKNDRGLPVSLSTFRLTSYDKAILETAAEHYGGEVKPWTDAPNPGMYELITASKAIDILIPRSLQSVTMAWELWSGGVCERRCDGVTETSTPNPQPCLCGDKRGEEGQCDVITRLSVILPRIPGLGLWRLDTGGYNAATTIPSTLQLLLNLDQRAMVPATLRAVERSSKVRLADGKVITRRFITPVLDAPGITIGQMVDAGDDDVEALPETVERPAPPTAAERVAARRQAVEANQAVTSDVATPTAGGAGGAPSPAVIEASGSGTPTAPSAVADVVPTTSPAGVVQRCGSPSPYGDGGDQATCSREVGHPQSLMCSDGSATWPRPKDWR